MEHNNHKQTHGYAQDYVTAPEPQPPALEELTREIDAHLPDTPVSSLAAMQAIVKADGNLDLAAIRLHTKKANILAAIVTDPANHDTLARYFRAHQVLRMFTMIEEVSATLMPQLDALKPADLARTLTGLLDTFAKFTEHSAQPQAQGNPIENTLKLFPPHVQQAIRALAANNDATATSPTVAHPTTSTPTDAV